MQIWRILLRTIWMGELEGVVSLQSGLYSNKFIPFLFITILCAYPPCTQLSTGIGMFLGVILHFLRTIFGPGYSNKALCILVTLPLRGEGNSHSNWIVSFQCHCFLNVRVLCYVFEFTLPPVVPTKPQFSKKSSSITLGTQINQNYPLIPS